MSIARSFCPEPGGAMPPINPQGILFIQGVLGRAKLHLMRHYIDPRVRAVHAVSATDVAYKSIADKIVDFEKESKALHFVRNNIEDDNKALPPQPGCSKCALCDQEVWNKSSNHVYCRVARQERTFRMAPSPTKDCDNWSEPIQDFACENTIVGITVVGRGLDAASCGVAMGMAKMTCDTTVDGHGHERSSHVRHSTLRFNEEVTMYVEGRMATLGHHRKEIPMTLTEQNVGDRVKASTSDSGATTKASRDWDTIAVPLPSLLYFVVRVMISWPPQVWTNLLTEVDLPYNVGAPKAPVAKDFRLKTLTAIMKRSPSSEHFYPLGDPG